MTTSRKPADLIRQRAAKLGADMLDLLEALARAGDAGAAKAILNKSTPDLRPVAAMVTFNLPKGQDITAASWAVLTAISAGKLSPDIGASLIASLAQIARITEVTEFDRRLAALEGQQT
jgi:hypothetical protein